MYHLLQQWTQLGNVVTMIDYYSKKNDDKKTMMCYITMLLLVQWYDKIVINVTNNCYNKFIGYKGGCVITYCLS